MNISFIPQLKSNTLKPQTFSKNQALKPLACDIVQFSGRSFDSDVSANVREGVEFGNKILNLIENKDNYDIYTLEKIIRAQNPDVAVFPVQKLKEINPEWQHYEAMYCSDLGDDYKHHNRRLFLKIRKNADEYEKILSVTGCAHEYTHVRQEANRDEALEFIKALNCNNPMEAKLFLGFAEQIFPFFDNQLQAFSCMGAVSKTQTPMEALKYGQILPKEALATKNDIFLSLKIRNDDDFNKLVKQTFDAKFTDTYDEIKNLLPKDLFEKIPYINNPDKLKSLIMAYCRIKAQNEFEAYTTESILAHQITGKKNLVTDIFPIYYKMLENALK